MNELNISIERVTATKQIVRVQNYDPSCCSHLTASDASTEIVDIAPVTKDD